jgi:hypothetical protein
MDATMSWSEFKADLRRQGYAEIQAERESWGPRDGRECGQCHNEMEPHVFVKEQEHLYLLHCPECDFYIRL